MISRIKIASHLASGLSGWHQLQNAQGLGDFPGEDSAQNLAAQIVNAQGSFAPAASQLPPNWGSTKRRVDVALLGRSAKSITWYGVVELKWPGTAFDPHQVREQIVQDIIRVSFVKTNSLNAKFFVLGRANESITKLFDIQHLNGCNSENRREAFNDLLSRD